MIMICGNEQTATPKSTTAMNKTTILLVADNLFGNQ